MKTYYVFELFVAFFGTEITKALECQNQNNLDYCMIKGYNRDQLPPYPPLNVSFNFDVKVRIFNIVPLRRPKVTILFVLLLLGAH